MEEFGFDKLPEVIRRLFEKVEHIEAILSKIKLEQNEAEKILSLDEAAKYLKITTAALYSMTSRRLVPFNKPGKRFYFVKSDLDAWVHKSKQKTKDGIITENSIVFGYKNWHISTSELRLIASNLHKNSLSFALPGSQNNQPFTGIICKWLFCVSHFSQTIQVKCKDVCKLNNYCQALKSGAVFAANDQIQMAFQPVQTLYIYTAYNPIVTFIVLNLTFVVSRYL